MTDLWKSFPHSSHENFYQIRQSKLNEDKQEQEELVKFAMTHEGASQVNIIDSVVADAISPGLDEYEGLNAKDRENISRLFLEFVDLCGTTHDIRKAWNRHYKLFPQSLRIRASYKHSKPGNCSIDLARDLKGTNQLLRDPCYQELEQVHQFPINDEIQSNWVAGKPLPQKDHIMNSKETGQLLTTGVLVSCNDGESQGNELAYQTSSQSKEVGPEPMVVSAELKDQAKENALSIHDSDQELLYRSRGDELEPMDVSAEFGIQRSENALSSHEIRKSTEITEPIEASCSSLIPVQPELNLELKQQKCPISSDNVSLNSQEKESHEISIESSKVCTELGRDGFVNRQHSTPKTVHTDPEEPSRKGEDSINTDCTVLPPAHTTSGFEEHTQQKSAGNKHSMSELTAVQEHRATNEHQLVSTITPLNNMPAGPPPISSQQVSYPPQRNTNEVTSLSGQQPLQAQHSLSMDQIHYHYQQQQQLLQQQYQQQLHMQNTYFQHYMNQQPYQSSTYQQSQQMQGHEPHPNYQQGQTLYHQSQDFASYQAYQTAYQQQQLLWQQQYQQYQGYQQQQQQQQHQSREGSVSMLEEHHHQIHPEQNLTQSMGQSQKGNKTALADYDVTAKTSVSPHQVLQ